MSFIVSAVTSDFVVIGQINMSPHTQNPQAFEALPGGFIIIDWEGNSSMAYVLDGQGRMLNETTLNSSRINLSSISPRIEGIRLFEGNSSLDANKTLLALDDNPNDKRIIRINLTNLTRYDALWKGMSPGNFSLDDDLSGMCTNHSNIYVALKNRDVINTLGGTNSSVNQTGEFSIPETNNAGALDCFGANLSGMYILDDTTGVVIITKKEDFLKQREAINISNLTGIGDNKFTDISVISQFDFWVLSNFTRTAYHIVQRNNLEVSQPNFTLSYPNNDETFRTRFPKVNIVFNISIFQGNLSIFTPADRINCSLYINGTFNMSTFATNNESINTSMNLSSVYVGDYIAQVRCKANTSGAAEKASGIKYFHVRTYKTLFWAQDNFTLYHNSDTSSLELVMGNDSSVLQAPYNITIDKPVAIRIKFNNATRNRSIFIDGIYVASDSKYNFKGEKPSRLYLGSNNLTGQINGVLSYFQTSNKEMNGTFRKGDYIASWTDFAKDLREKFNPSYFFQYKVTLRRSITSENPMLRGINVTTDETLINESFNLGTGFMDFKFASATSSATPAGQTDSLASFTITNIGNASYALQAFSLTPFDGCFKVGIFNISTGGNTNLKLGGNNNTINLSITPQTIMGALGPGSNTSIWINATATSCSSSAEGGFDIKFTTSP